MTRAPDPPTPADPLDAPQLAAVAVLRAALIHAADALTAAHDELLGDADFDDSPPATPAPRVALDAIRLMSTLVEVLDHYRRSLAAPPEPPAATAIGVR